uniref:Uncharacterized protein n=1 Tax=Anguilla anguilla TaxID=7936 RepID=A0A0E9QTY6_ANGAN
MGQCRAVFSVERHLHCPLPGPPCQAPLLHSLQNSVFRIQMMLNSLVYSFSATVTPSYWKHHEQIDNPTQSCLLQRKLESLHSKKVEAYPSCFSS